MSPPYGRSVTGNRWDELDGVWPDEPPRVSVVVVHYRQQGELDRVLAALASQTHPADRLEVIVADDGSPEPPVVPAGVRVVTHEDRGYRAAATRNLGAAAATGDVLVFLDADTTPEPDFVRRITRLPALAPEAVTVGRRRHADFAGVPADAPVEAEGPPRELPDMAWLTRAYGESENLLRADARSYRFVISAVLACSRWFFTAEAGPFDAGFRDYGGEDWEWAHRAWLAGAILAHVPDAVGWHDGPDWSGRSAAGEARQELKNSETSRLAEVIAVPGSRGTGIRPRVPDVVIRLPPTERATHAWLSVDTLLAAVPEATVVVPDALLADFATDPRVVGRAADPAARARVVVDCEWLVRVRGDALRDAIDRIGPEDLGAVDLTDADGAPLVRVTSSRAVARARRWGTADGLPTVRVVAGDLEPITAEPDIEGHLGGWF